MSVRSRYEKRLLALRDEVPRLRQRLAMLDEQVAYVEEVADAARVRALTASTPLADRERRDAEEDLRRARSQRDEQRARLGEVLAEQDRLLERMLGQRGGAQEMTTSVSEEDR